MRRNKFFAVFLLIFSAMLFSCKNEESENSDDSKHFKIALILPISESQPHKNRYERITSWFANTLSTASDSFLSIDYEWYDENTINIEETAKNLSKREDIFAIVGPISSSNVEKVGWICKENQKPVITPIASSEEIIRNFSVSETGEINKPFLWSLTECDISQSQAILSKILSLRNLYSNSDDTSQSKIKIALISSADSYGQTFFQWIPFQVSSFSESLELTGSYRFKSKFTEESKPTDEAENSDRDTVIDIFLSSGADFGICAASDPEDIKAILEARHTMGDEGPKLIFTDSAFRADFLDSPYSEGMEGVTMYADPTTGFQTSYFARFNEIPFSDEAFLYDSLLLASCGFQWCLKHNKDTPETQFSNENIQIAFQKLTENSSANKTIPSWTALGLDGILLKISSLNEDDSIHLVGATGHIHFDKESWTSSVCTVYMHWTVQDGKFIAIDYMSEKGSGRVVEMQAAWKVETAIQALIGEIDFDYDPHIEYDKEIREKQAVLVAASTNTNTLLNYRHQADALNIYQILKSNGYDDDHIILIIADDITNRLSNRTNEVRVSPKGPNLYHDLEIDYNLKDISVNDFCNILTGNQTENLKAINEKAPVLTGDSKTDVFIFWSGHGTNISGDETNGYLLWGGKRDEMSQNRLFSKDLLGETLNTMHKKNMYRKMFFMLESCYAKSVANIIENEEIPGILCMMASNGKEESFADSYSYSLRAYMTNRFTKNFLTYYSDNISFKDIYEKVAKTTTGSHVQILNTKFYDQLSTEFPAEFLEYEYGLIGEDYN